MGNLRGINSSFNMAVGKQTHSVVLNVGAKFHLHGLELNPTCRAQESQTHTHTHTPLHWDGFLSGIYICACVKIQDTSSILFFWSVPHSTKTCEAEM